MPVTRRNFLRRSGAATAALAWGRPFELGAVSQHATSSPGRGPTALRADSLEKFVDALPIPSTAQPAGSRNLPVPNTIYYRVVMRAIESRVHRDLPPTLFWSFGTTFPGPTFEARRGQGLWIDWVNQLPKKHFLPIDHTIHGAEAGVPEGRAVVHVHGARVPPESDGYPERWVETGTSASYYYPNDQDAATLWYHDHTMGINRLNVYAGLMGVYVVRDAVEDALNLPRDQYDIPLLICDRLLRSDGQLDYPTSGNPESPWVEDATGDAILINGRLFPFLDVEPRKYRFRLINGSNGRFLRLSIVDGPAMHQIATDQGLMASPVEVERVRLAPAERCDVVIDFAGARNRQIVIENDGQPIVQLRVSGAAVSDRSAVPHTLRNIEPLKDTVATRTRIHTLSQEDDLLARPMRMLLNRTRWHMPVTEQVELDTTEIWNLVNLTDDSHPIHLHLVRFQILDRRNFDSFNYQSQGRIVFTGPPLPPDPSEAGWKDTVRADPRMITRIIIRFEGYAGRYMWHCHLLEHGDNEMMRPLDIVAP